MEDRMDSFGMEIDPESGLVTLFLFFRDGITSKIFLHKDGTWGSVVNPQTGDDGPDITGTERQWP